MFFIRSGAIVAWIAALFGLIKLCTGLFVALTTETNVQMALLSKRYFNAANSGEIIDGGLKFLFGVALGLLVEIAKNKNQ